MVPLPKVQNMNPTPNPVPAPQNTGLWLVGARGAISTTLAIGLGALRQKMAEPTGILTETPAFNQMDWVSLEGIFLGGHDVCQRSVQAAAKELEQAHVVPPGLVDSLKGWLDSVEADLRPGVMDSSEETQGFDPQSVALSKRTPREQIARLQGDWEAFERNHGLGSVVVVYVASTEESREADPAWEDLADFEAYLDRGERPPASMLYAYAALFAGRPFVNFTPNRGADCGALRELALERGVPHCGQDGKTGETLLKTSLAPMMHARALKVLAWQGYNMLGNRDGESLRKPGHREAKLANKDEALRSILQQEGAAQNDQLHSHVAIDFVPSLGDWKTAWDFVHFEGFLGTRMSLQFTWVGSDSALAAPLLLDLTRLAERALRRGETGAMAYTACFFKAPLSGGSHDFHRQYHALIEYLGRA